MPKFKVQLSEHDSFSHDFSEETVSIGRLPDNRLAIEDASVSSHHAELRFDGSEYHIKDLDSTNGTFVNGVQVTDEKVSHGDAIRFGKVETTFLDKSSLQVDKQPLPESGSTEITLGTASARPANYQSSSPFPPPQKKGDLLALAAVVAGVLGIVGFAVAAFLSLGLAAPI